MIVGIDLGTSNSMAAVYRDGQPVLIESKTGSHCIPSVVSMDEHGFFYTGDEAVAGKKTNMNCSVGLFKRSMGTSKMFSLGKKELKAEELSAILLKSIKEQAEAFVGEKITEAVIGVPAFFNNLQRKAVLRAGELAGLHVKKLMNEPTAAAIAYGIQKREKDNEGDEQNVIMVLDIGGGTFDISIMETTDTVMEVISICGDNHLGGEDFTQRLIELFLLHNHLPKEMTQEEESMLWSQAQEAKNRITLEGKGRMCCTLNQKEYDYEITEEEYEQECMDFLERIRQTILQAVRESKYEPEEISDIIMVGGGTKLSIIRKMVEKMIGRKLQYKIHPDEAVAMGTAIQGALLEKDEGIRDLVMTDVCPYYIGVQIWDRDAYDIQGYFDVAISKNTVIPARRILRHWDNPHGFAYSTIIQSDNEYGIGGIEIGELKFTRPKMGTKDRIEVQKIITYDTNGIIYLEAYIPANGMCFKSVIRGEDSELSMEDVKRRENELKNLVFGISEVDDLIIARAERLYTECLGRDREQIDAGIQGYEAALKTGKARRIQFARENLINVLNTYEKSGYGGVSWMSGQYWESIKH